MIITEEMIHRSAEAAANWWGDRLKDDDIYPDFRRILAQHIVNEFSIRGNPRVYWDHLGFNDYCADLLLSVNYSSDDVLRRSMYEAKVHESIIERSALPWKTTMWCSPRRVLVRHGENTNVVEIYGPVWGTTYESQTNADNYRREQANMFYTPLWLMKSDWSGPVPE